MKHLNFGKLVKLLDTENKQIEFLQKHGILKKSDNCSKCGMHLDVIHRDRKYNYFYCNDCKSKSSIRANSVLSNANISMRKFALLVYVFVSNFWTYRQIMVSIFYRSHVSIMSISCKEETDLTSEEEESDSEQGTNSVLSSSKINKYFTMFRDVICEEM